MNCDRCGLPLDKPGALLFSPPDIRKKVLKRHICLECYGAIDLELIKHFQKVIKDMEENDFEDIM